MKQTVTLYLNDTDISITYSHKAYEGSEGMSWSK